MKIAEAILKNAGVDWAMKISDSNKDESVQAQLQKKHPYLNNVKVISGPHTQSEARAIAKEAREKGKFYSVFHLDGPKSGPQSKYAVTAGRD